MTTAPMTIGGPSAGATLTLTYPPAFVDATVTIGYAVGLAGAPSVTIAVVLGRPEGIGYRVNLEAHPIVDEPPVGPPGGMYDDNSGTWIFAPDELWEPET